MLLDSHRFLQMIKTKKTKPTLITKDGKNCYEKEKLPLK